MFFDGVTDFEVCGSIKNAKKKYLENESITFSSCKKQLYIKGNITTTKKNTFLAEVIFNAARISFF